MRPGRILFGLFVLLGSLLTVAQAQDQEKQNRYYAVHRTEYKSLQAGTVYELSSEVGRGKMVTDSAPLPGFLRTSVRLTMSDGVLLRREVLDTQRMEPEAGVILLGEAGFASNHSTFTKVRSLSMKASAYDPSAGRGSRATFRTATGRRAAYGVVAVDPRHIKLGTMLFVEGYGLALAADTGGAIKGNRIDLCMNTTREALLFGRRTVKVHVLKPIK